MTPEEEKLLKYYEEYKNDLDGGYLNTMARFAEDCFLELTSLGNKAKVRDVFKYLAAVHHVTVNRKEDQFRKHLDAVRKLKD